ncbi:MAG: tail fiber domain-containing protein [Bacteroidia bacterium]|nr:tail fiber domain-containing protein [Bacteroidia bacterium]
MKKLVFLISVMSIFINAQSQITLNGYTGINGPPAVGYPLNVTSYYGKIIMIDPSLTESIIGSSTDVINFYYSSSIGHNKVYAQSFSTTSDSTVKKNIETLSPGALHKVLSLRPISFEFKKETNASTKSKLKKIGLVAQEVEAIVPEAVSFSEVGNVKMIDYNMLIPVLIKAIQEQQTTIENLQKEIDRLNPEKDNLKSATSTKDIEQEVISVLEQNAPNPFTQITEIRYNLSKKSQKATLYIYNMNGIQIKSIQIAQKGQGSVIIKGSELKAGMYLYTLIVDGKEIDTKRMILTQ